MSRRPARCSLGNQEFPGPACRRPLGTEAGGGARRRANQGREAVCLVNAGLKALAFDSGPPLICDELSVTYDPT